jgi:hypothetical protein
MIIGQAAGVAASLAIEGGKAVQDISIPALQQKLRQHNAAPVHPRMLTSGLVQVGHFR